MPVAAAAKTPEELAAEAAAAPVIEDIDNFASAFEELAKLGDKPVTDEAIAGKPPVAAPAAPVKAVEEEVVPTPAEEGDLPNPDAQIAADEAAAAAAKETTPVAPARTAAEDVLERLAERLAPVAPKEPQQPVKTPEPDFSPEEASFLANYVKEFPDVAKAEALIRRAEAGQIVAYVFGEVQKALAPMSQQLSQLATNTHVKELQSEVTDYREIRGKVVEWIGTQPDYLQAAYNNVVQHGTKDQVIDLINRYRTASGAAAPAAQPATSGQVKETELPPAAKQAAAKLAPVSSKRSATVVSPSKEDFDGAFADFAKETT